MLERSRGRRLKSRSIMFNLVDAKVGLGVHGRLNIKLKF